MPLLSQKTYLEGIKGVPSPLSLSHLAAFLSASEKEERTEKALPPSPSGHLPLVLIFLSFLLFSIPFFQLPLPSLSLSFSPPSQLSVCLSPPCFSPHPLSFSSLTVFGLPPSPASLSMSLPLSLNHKGGCDITPSVLVVGCWVASLLLPTALSAPVLVYTCIHTYTHTEVHTLGGTPLAVLEALG